MRTFTLFLCSFLLTAETWSFPLSVEGKEKTLRSVRKVIEALGGKEGLKKRRSVHQKWDMKVHLGTGEQKPAMHVSWELWIKGKKQRTEQTMGSMAGMSNTIIYDGDDLFIVANGVKRNPGELIKKSFQADLKRQIQNLWWNCLRKPLHVRSLGMKKVEEETLLVLEFTHKNEDKTVVGIRPETYLPVYSKYKAPNPNTGKTITVEGWQTHFAPAEEAGGLLFPRKQRILFGGRQMATGSLKAVETREDIPDSLFELEKERPVD